MPGLTVVCALFAAVSLTWSLPADAQSVQDRDGTGCVYGKPKDPASLFSVVGRLAKAAGAPGEPVVNISFNRSEASVTVSAGGYSLTVRWRAETECKRPFTTLSAPPPGAPAWAARLHGTLAREFPHQPASSVGRSNTQPVRSAVPAGLLWLALLISVLIFMGHKEAVPETPVGNTRYWVWGALALGGIYLVMRWWSGMTMNDELAYLFVPGGDQGDLYSLQYYLKDAGLPSLVHRLVLIAIHPLGGLTALSVVHFILYVIYGLTIYRMCSELVPGGVAAVISVFCLCNPTTLLYVGEHRSYVSFLTFSVLGQLMMLRYIRTANLRCGMWMVLFLGLSALDNPLCIIVLVSFTACTLLVPQWRQRLHPYRLLTVTLLMTLAVAPVAFTASQAHHGGTESVSRWLIASCFYVGPLILLRPMRPNLGPLRLALLFIWLLLMVPMAFGYLPWNAQKIELFVLPLFFAGSAAAIIGKLGAEKRPPLVLVPLVIAVLVLYAWPLNLHNEVQELETYSIANQIESLNSALTERQETTPIDAYWGREWKRVQYASLLVRIDPFAVDGRKILGLPKFYKFVDGGWPKDQCGKGRPFAVIVAPYGPSPSCSSCRLLVGNSEVWHAWECR